MKFEVVIKAEDEEEANQLECRINKCLGANYAKVRDYPDRKKKQKKARA